MLILLQRCHIAVHRNLDLGGVLQNVTVVLFTEDYPDWSGQQEDESLRGPSKRDTHVMGDKPTKAVGLPR